MVTRTVAALERARRSALAALIAIAVLAIATPAAHAQASALPRPPATSAPVASAWDSAEGRGRVVDAVVALFAAEYHVPEQRDWVSWGAEYREAAAVANGRAAFDAVMARMLRSLADGHSSWLGRAAATPAPVRRSSNEAEPVRLGVQLAYVVDRGLVVERVYPSTPADRAGLRRADVITAVGGLDLRGSGSLFAANAALADALSAGPAVLTIERGRVRFDLDVVGTAVDFDAVAARPYAALLDDGVGYLHVPTFNADDVAADVHAAVRGLVASGVRALVLDLRGNLGGRVLEAGLTFAAFGDGTWSVAIARGEEAWRATAGIEAAGGGSVAVSRLRDADGTSFGVQRLADPVRFDGPVVVLVGSENASAAEVLAAALVEGIGARVVGERTSGNVEAVRAFDLPDGSRVLVAIADLRSPSGASLVGGVTPDVVARADVRDLARGVDPPVAEARRLLGALPFTPGTYF
ncbi:MAG: S41 family peptidase [Trueperaceae bacterium]